MKVCLIGNNLTALSLGKNLVNKKIEVSNYVITNKIRTKTSTIGITKDNLDFFNKEIINLKKKMTWDIDKIDIFYEKYKYQKILNFKNSKSKLFSIFENNQVFKCLEKSLKKNKYFKRIYIKNDKFLKKNLSKNFDIIINCDVNNFITREYFYKKINKNYNSKAFTCIIEHKNIKNRTASQIFTKFGPIAFLPLSNIKTSIVFSVSFSNRKFDNQKIFDLIRFYNNKYEILKFSNLEKFNLSFSQSRNYFYKNILAFGDVIHRVHPLAGQGFNITIRDIKILSEIIQKRLELGLPVDTSVLKEFEKKTKHFNYIFSSAIDVVHEIFKFDNKIGINISKEIFKFINNNKKFNQFFIKYANRGIVL